MTVTKTEAQNGGKKLYYMEVTELDKTRLLLVVSIGRLIFEFSVYPQERGYI